MPEYSISPANLNVIENNIHQLANNINTLARNMEVVSNQVNTVDQKVEVVYSELDQLTRQFKEFVDESKRIAALADAKQTVVMLEQELQKKFGYYEEIRRHTTGILQATDISLVRKETISTITEELMVSAPRYWLAPALIALSAWLSDNRELAERALKEAMRRDDEKTSLLFCLISRRAGRFNGSLVWLERYFGMQDPAKMERKVIAVLDAFASGLFGPDAKGICSEKIKAWIDELSSRAGFIEAQKEQWSKAIEGKISFVNDSEFPYLTANSPTWPQLRAVLSWAKTHGDIYTYFSSIFSATPESVASVTAQVDNILDSLVANYDNEELPLRREVRRNKLIIEENGYVDRALVRFDTESPAYEPYMDFSQHLTNVALSPESSGALKVTQKFAISMSKEWITNAYEDLTAKSRSQVPTDIQIKLSDWIDVTRDGSNEHELQESLNEYVNTMLEKTLAQVKFTLMHWVALVGGGAVFLLGLFTVNFFFMILGLGAASFWLYGKTTLDKNKNQVRNQIEEFRINSQTALKATIAEVVDFRRLYTEKDADYNKVIDFLHELSPQQYVAVGETKARQVL